MVRCKPNVNIPLAETIQWNYHSLEERSHRPKYCPNEQSKEEYALIERYFPYYDDMIMLRDRLREKGYKRCYQTMLCVIRRLGLEKALEKRHHRKPKPIREPIIRGRKSGLT